MATGDVAGTIAKLKAAIDKNRDRKAMWKSIALLALSFPSMILAPYVLQNLWNWFAAPTLNSQPIGYWQACGMRLLIGFFRDRINAETSAKETGDTEFSEAIVYPIGLIVTLAMGWIIHDFLQ